MTMVLARGAGVALAVLLAACAPPPEGDVAGAPQDTTQRVAVVTGLTRPEAVRYDEEQDVWFVANFGAAGDEARDANGFISRLRADGTIDALQFMRGTTTHPLHMPRGMAIRGDTLWVADVDGVHGFDRRTGAQRAFVDMRALEPGFINDLAFAPDGTLYATDTGRARVYRIAGGAATVAVEDSLTGPPNGITWDAARRVFLLAPWGGGQVIRAWDPASGALREAARVPGARIDGIEVVDGAIVAASQRDSTIYVVTDGRARAAIRVPGAPADIGIDTRRRRIAVPYIALDRVDIWDLR